MRFPFIVMSAGTRVHGSLTGSAFFSGVPYPAFCKADIRQDTPVCRTASLPLVVMLLLTLVQVNPTEAWTQTKSAPVKPLSATASASSTSTVPAIQPSGTGGSTGSGTASGSQSGSAGYSTGMNLPVQGTVSHPGAGSSPKGSISTYVVKVRTSIVGLPASSQDQTKPAASQSGTRTSPQSGLPGSGAAAFTSPVTTTVSPNPSSGNVLSKPAQVPGGIKTGLEGPASNASLASPADSGKNFLELLDRNARWSSATSKPAAPGQPIQVKLVGATVAAVIHLVPSENQSGGLDIIASAQVWIQEPDGSIQSRTTMSLLTVTLSERMFFFPLGYSPDGSSPLILEIVVDKASR